MSRDYRMAVFDLDGTLLDQGVLSETARQLLPRLQEADVEVVVATGRSLPMVPKCIRQFPFIRYIISSGGAVVTDVWKNKTLWSASIEKKPALALLKAAAGFHGGSNVYFSGLAAHSRRMLYISKSLDSAEAVKNMYAEFSRRSPKVTAIRLLARFYPAPIEKIDCRFLRNQDLEAFRQQASRLKGLRMTDIGGSCLEFTAEDVDKATGLKALLRHLDLPISAVVAFGDSENDISMLKAAGLGVAMGNAPQTVQAVTGKTAPPVQEDGAVKAALEIFGIGSGGGPQDSHIS